MVPMKIDPDVHEIIPSHSKLQTNKQNTIDVARSTAKRHIWVCIHIPLLYLLRGAVNIHQVLHPFLPPRFTLAYSSLLNLFP